MKMKFAVVASVLASLISAAAFAHTDGCVVFLNNTNASVSVAYLTSTGLHSNADGHNVTASTTTLWPAESSQAIYLSNDDVGTAVFNATYSAVQSYTAQVKVEINDHMAPYIKSSNSGKISFSDNHLAKTKSTYVCYDANGVPEKSDYETIFNIKN